jgi:5-oxoprolinase (ATP-hydrolysing) subunit A
VHRQIVVLDEIAHSLVARILHVKPHGALYNQAARDANLARAIAEGVARWSTDAILVGLAGSVMLAEFRKAKFRVAAEAFADRRYESDGTLRSRKFADAMLQTPQEAAAQALSIVQKGCVLSRDSHVVPIQADTICIHGDTPGALQTAEAIDIAFDAAHITRKRLTRNELH